MAIIGNPIIAAVKTEVDDEFDLHSPNPVRNSIIANWVNDPDLKLYYDDGTKHLFLTKDDGTRLDSGVELRTDVDSSFDKNSSNPVQNSVIANWVDAPQLMLDYDEESHMLYLAKPNGTRIDAGVEIISGGGGGGGSSNDAVMKIANTTGWMTKTVTSGMPCTISFNWSSLLDGEATGNGSMALTVNNVPRSTQNIAQGSVSADIEPYLSKGQNNCSVRVTDAYGNSRQLIFVVEKVELTLKSSFDVSEPFNGDIPVPYTASGGTDAVKKVYFYVDGNLVKMETTNKSNEQMTCILPAQENGAHTLRMYFTVFINGEDVPSNTLYYEFISMSGQSDDTVITSSFNLTEVDQYSSVEIKFRVYSTLSYTTETRLYINGTLVQTLTADRSEQHYTFRADDPGTVTFQIRAGRRERTFRFTVNGSDANIEPVTQNMALYLSARGRSSNEATREQWSYGNIAASLTGFNWRTNGWQKDEDGIDVLRLNGDARVTIPYQPFASDCTTGGKTIEIEFETRDVADYSATLVSCAASAQNDPTKLIITPQNMMIRGEQTQLDAMYKENEHLRLAIVIEKQTEDSLILIYLNGVMSRAVQYASGESFAQRTPAGITIGSQDCGIDIYNIRVYDNSLTRRQVLNNWIADTQIGALMLQRYNHNKIYNQYDNVTTTTLPHDLPYMILECPALPQYKGDKKKDVSGSYTDPVDPYKSFTFEGVEIDAQGTSSSVYFRKNWDLKFKSGFNVERDGVIVNEANYALRTGSIPFNRFVLKADVASSESTNNTGLTMFYNDTCPYKTPAQVQNPKVRQGIEGVPMVLFWYNPDTMQTEFLGKHNFNLPKRCPEPLGFSGDMESWEWERNNSANVKFQDTDWTTMKYDQLNDRWYPEWYDDFEARYPDDTYRDITKLNEFISWVKSTWRDEATNEALPQSVTYTLPTDATVRKFANDYNPGSSYAVGDLCFHKADGDMSYGTLYRCNTKITNGETWTSAHWTADSRFSVAYEMSDGRQTGNYIMTFTTDSPAYRLTKFRAECADYVEIDSAVYYYLFTEMFLMIDSRAKNMFPSFIGGPVTQPGRQMTRKVVIMPYDMDTAIGINNSGILMFGFSLEDTDQVDSVIVGGDDAEAGKLANVFNAQDSVFWCNLRDSFRSNIVQMYTTLRTSGQWTYQRITDWFTAHQSKWPEAVFNEDAFIKYIYPLENAVTYNEDTKTYETTDRYLTMLQGSKAEQRKWWLFNRFRYMDSKFLVGDAASNTIDIRLFNAGTLQVKTAIDLYVNVRFGLGSTPEQKRTTAGTATPFTYAPKTGVQEMETSIYSADMITDVGDLSVFHPNECNFAKATKLKRLKIGDSSANYSNGNMKVLDVKNCRLLESIDVRNCPNLTQTVNLENSSRLKEAYFDGTAITGAEFTDGGVLETVHFPSTITSLSLLNLTNLRELVIPDYSNLTRVMIANIDPEVLDPIAMLSELEDNTLINIQGFSLSMQNLTAVNTFLNSLDRFKGVTREKDANGQWIYHYPENAQVAGTIHVPTLTTDQVRELKQRYEGIEYTADNWTYRVWFYNGDEMLYTQVVAAGGSVVDPLTNGNIQEIPTREPGDGHIYSYRGWDQDFSNVQSDMIIQAEYDTEDVCTVRFVNDDAAETELYTTLVRTGGNVDDPVVYHLIEPPTKETDEHYVYTYIGWDSALTNITTDRTIKARYATDPSVVVTFVNWDGTRLKQQYIAPGDSVADPVTTEEIARPTRPDNTQTQVYYVYAGWDKALTNIRTSTTITATFTAVQYYLVTFRNQTEAGGNTLYETRVDSGASVIDPVVSGDIETPTRTPELTYNYIYKGWDSALSTNVTSNLTYTAQYKTDRQFTVNFYDWDGTRLSTQLVADEDDAVAIQNPTRDATDQSTYSFAGWSTSQGGSVTPNATKNITAPKDLYAVYTEAVRTYTVIWKNANGTVLETDNSVPYGTTPTYNGATPTQDGAQATGWNPEVGPITGNTVYTATYIPIYTATFVRSSDDGGGTLWSGRFEENTVPVYGGATPTTTRGTAEEFEFMGWEPSLTAITANTTYTAKFRSNSLVVQFLERSLTEYMSSATENTFEYTLIQPLMYDYVKGYINGSATEFVYEDSTTCRSDIYSVQVGHVYLLRLDDTVGTRFRVMLSTQRPIENESQITYGDSISGSAIYIANNPSPNASVSFTATSNGYVIVQKDNTGVSGLKTYLYDLE